MSRRFARRQGWRTFLWPAVMAIVSGGGLATSLAGDGLWDWLGALALLLPVLVVAARLAGTRYG